MRPPRGLTMQQRLDRLSEPAESGCIVWTGSTDGRMGYGKIRTSAGMTYVHRIAYKWPRYERCGQPDRSSVRSVTSSESLNRRFTTS